MRGTKKHGMKHMAEGGCAHGGDGFHHSKNSIDRMADGGAPKMTQHEYSATRKAFNDLENEQMPSGGKMTYSPAEIASGKNQKYLNLSGAKADYEDQNDQFERANPGHKGGGGIHIKASHRGLLHKDLGVKAGEKIPAAKLEKAEHSEDPAERKRAVFARNAKSWHHGK